MWGLGFTDIAKTLTSYVVKNMDSNPVAVRVHNQSDHFLSKALLLRILVVNLQVLQCTTCPVTLQYDSILCLLIKCCRELYMFLMLFMVIYPDSFRLLYIHAPRLIPDLLWFIFIPLYYLSMCFPEWTQLVHNVLLHLLCKVDLVKNHHVQQSHFVLFLSNHSKILGLTLFSYWNNNKDKNNSPHKIYATSRWPRKVKFGL